MARKKYSNKYKYKKKKGHKNGPSNKSLDKKIKHIENNLIELKYADTYGLSSPIIALGVEDFLLPVDQGDEPFQRNGNMIWPTSIQCRISLTANQATILSTRVRCILFWDAQSNGQVPLLLGGFGTSSLLFNNTILDPTLAPRNYDTIKRYHILYDSTFVLTPQVVQTQNLTTGNSSALVPAEKFITFTKKLSRGIKYFDQFGIPASVVTNSLWMAYFSDATTNFPVATTGYRLYYKDA